MKALIISSTHALCDISELERDACNRACALHGIPLNLSTSEHARILATTTMLDLLNQANAAPHRGRSLIDSYLDFLNEGIWGASVRTHDSVFAALLDRNGFTQPKAFVSDYPLLTTNLVRSTALLTNATKLGHLTTQSDLNKLRTTVDGLEAAAASLGVSHRHIEVLVAHRRDYLAAQSIGMSPRLVEELWQPLPAVPRQQPTDVHVPMETVMNDMSASRQIAISA